MASSGTKPVITRFAPSPTGKDIFTSEEDALRFFSYLYAKHHGGQFRLRIEDTDADRHDEEAAKAIINGMEWLGCKHDGEIVRQSQQKARHQEIANKLVSENKAYKCYCSKEELEAMRAEADKNKVPFRYPGKCRDVPADFTPPAGVEPVVRIKTEIEGSTKWTDKVQGTIEFPNKDIDDFIILRSDGSPTYLLAVVVDDHDMEITDVIRGSDHISNTPRQLQIYKQCGWEPPFFGHIPLIHGMDGQKLSKRHGATGVEQYEALGYLPEAMRNYLARLSWSHGNDEIFTTEQAIEWFDLKDCSKSASCFDFDKLKDLNAHYIKECDNARLLALATKFYPELKPFEAQLNQAVDMLKPRAKTIVEYREAAEWIVAARPLTLEAAAAKNTINDKAKPVLADVKEALTAYSGAWDAASLEPVINQFAETKGLKLGQVAQPLRGALTGTTASPGIYEVMWVLGKEGVLGRIDDVLNGLNKVKDPPVKAEAPPKEEKKDKKDKGGKAAPAAADQPEFTKLDIRVGQLTKTWHHPDSDKLWCEEIDIGEAEPRQVASGLRAHYEADKFCAGRKVLVVVNLKPAKMAGFESAGMVLCAATEDHSKVELLEVPDAAKVGERVFIEGLSGEPLQPNQVAKKSVLKYVLPDLKTDGGCVACWQGKQILTSAGPVKAPTMSDSPVG